ncbi:MAG: UDP-N-acetylmuramate--L-alanine ligase, partial [Luteibaculum sp.]
FSRTRDFMQGFAEELAKFSEVLLLPIYPAREEPIPGINSEAILSKMKKVEKKLITPFDLLKYAAGFTDGVLVMVGAGDIAKMVEPVKRIMAGTENVC